MSLNIFIYNNHNILVCIVKKHRPKPYAMVITKQHLQFKILTEITKKKIKQNQNKQKNKTTNTGFVTGLGDRRGAGVRGGRTRRDEQKRDETIPVGCYRRVMIVLAFQLLSDLALKAPQPLCPVPAAARAPPALCHLLGRGMGAVRRGRGVGCAGQAVGGRCGSWGLWWGFLVAHPDCCTPGRGGDA